jgi:3-oxoacyl-[acyl-carrier protein] reductase
MKTVLITGGSRGLGLAIAHKLLAEGYQVIAVSRSCPDGLREAMERFCGMLHYEYCDFAELEGIHEFARRIGEKYGRLYGLVNNAAVGYDSVLATMHERDISTLLRINLEAPILLTKYLLRPMLINGKGRVVNVSSIIASSGFSGLSVYAASKAGLIGFTKSLAREVGRADITVNAVAPGYMETEMTSGLQGDKLKSIVRRSPLRCLPTVDDVAPAVSYLMSDAAARTTGVVITVDAGSTA